MNKYEYTTEGADYPEEAVAFNSTWSLEFKQFIAEDAGKDFYNGGSNSDDFPIKLTIYGNGKNIGTFEVSFEPVFCSVAVGE